MAKEEAKQKIESGIRTTVRRMDEKDKLSLDDRRKRALGRIQERTRRPRGRRSRDEDELDVRLVSIRRVSKVKAGGKRLRLSVMVVIGDKKGNIGVAIGKGKDVRSAQEKAVNKAKKNMIKVLLKGQTIPHEVTIKYKAAKVMLKPAVPGTGVIAGGAVRAVVEASGIKDILSKVLGTKNTIPNVYATFNALKSLKLTRFKDEN
ncbi:MAG: 30S ribosomal protein S5 [Candidatus Dojkabacteria bacterium]|nr:30S ribosomal protein S5 [Candidatus Dojkabacteria bacterium]